MGVLLLNAPNSGPGSNLAVLVLHPRFAWPGAVARPCLVAAPSFAGHDTSALAATYVWYLLSRRPRDGIRMHLERRK